MADTPQDLLDKARAAAEAARQAADVAHSYADQVATAVGAAAHAATGGAIDPFVFRFAIFVLAIFVGYYVVWSVTPALHTPLMSVTNAISSVIVVGALLSVGVSLLGDAETGSLWARGVRLRRPDPRLDQHLRRLPRHPAHAGDVQAEGQAGQAVQGRLSPVHRPLRSGTMSVNLVQLLYLVAGVLFILALRGPVLAGHLAPGQPLRHDRHGDRHRRPRSAVVAARRPVGWLLVMLGLAIGGGIGAVVARRVAMTAMPQLVAAFHSGVGLAAVLRRRRRALCARPPSASAIAGFIEHGSLIEMSLGVAIGAVTFTGSVIAFAKLNGNMSGTPIMLPSRHLINIALAVLLVVLIVAFVISGEPSAVLADRAGGAGAGRPDHHPDRRRRHAGRRLDAQLLFRLGGGGHRLHARQPRPDHHRGAGRLVRRHPQLHHVQGDEPLVHLGDPRRLRRRRRGRRGQGAVETRPVKQGSADDAAFIMKNASKVIIVPGYGMAVAQAQHALREMGDRLKAEGVDVQIRHPPRRRPHARPHERAAGRGQRAL